MAENTIEEIWKDDLLGRKADADFLLTFLLKRLEERANYQHDPSYVLNIDARWGKGKTYFLDRFGKHLRQLGYVVAEVNAWQDDHADDPLLSVISAVDLALNPLLDRDERLKTAWERAKKSGATVAAAVTKAAVMHWASKALGEGAEVLAGAVGASENSESIEGFKEKISNSVETELDNQSAALIARFETSRKSIENFRDHISRLIEALGETDRRAPLFVLIDELDRCKPTYSILLLERVKHLFELKNIVFIIATDTDQLQHSIRAVYGTEFDAKRYLNRFFDRTYLFSTPKLHEFVEYQMRLSNFDYNKIALPFKIDPIDYISGAFDFFGSEPRDVEQCIDVLRSVVTTWEHPIPIELSALMPLIIGLHENITPSMTNKFHEDLQSLAGSGKLNNKSWPIRIDDNVGKVSGLRIFELFVQKMKLPLSKLLEMDPDLKRADGRVQQYIMDVARKTAIYLKDEGKLDHRRTYLLQSSYPDMVLSAGRLVPGLGD